VRLTAKSGRREARVGSINIAGAKTGVMDKDRIPFDYQLVRPGVYKIVPTADLAPGEYGFLFALNGNGAAAHSTHASSISRSDGSPSKRPFPDAGKGLFALAQRQDQSLGFCTATSLGLGRACPVRSSITVSRR
jgi:hypothetical protein